MPTALSILSKSFILNTFVLFFSLSSQNCRLKTIFVNLLQQPLKYKRKNLNHEKEENFLTWKIYLTPHTKSLSCFSLKTVITCRASAATSSRGPGVEASSLSKPVFQPHTQKKTNRVKKESRTIKNNFGPPKKLSLSGSPEPPIPAKVRSLVRSPAELSRTPDKSLLVFRLIEFVFSFLSLFLKKKLSRI